MKTKLLIITLVPLVLLLCFMFFTNIGRSWLKVHTSPEFIDLQGLGLDCNIAKQCGTLVGVNCKAEVDGPFYYVEKNTGKIVSKCGGYCMGGGCTNCPPKEWDCK